MPLPQSQIDSFALSATSTVGTMGKIFVEPTVTVTDPAFPSYDTHDTYTVSYSGFLSGDYLGFSGTAPGHGGTPDCGAGNGDIVPSGILVTNDPSHYPAGSSTPDPYTPASAGDITTFFESIYFFNQDEMQTVDGASKNVTHLHDVTVTFSDTNGGGAPAATQTVVVHVVPAGNALTVDASHQTIVSAAQTYTGKTLISGELDISAGGAIAPSQQVALKASGAVFDVSGAGTGGASVTIQELSGVAGTTIKLGAGVLSLTESVPATYAGAITDGGVAGGTGGGLVVNGTAPLTLSGADTYTGKTQIYGQLDLAGAAVLNTSKAVTLKSASAVFDISQATGKEAILNLAGVAGSHIYLGANTLKINDSTAATFSGVIADGGAAGGVGGALIVKGTVPLVLAGANTFTGGVTLQTGTLELTTPTSAGGGGHALTFSGAATLQLDAGALAGSGTSHSYATSLAGFAAGDHVDLASLTYAAGATATYNGSTLTVTSGGASVALTLSGPAAGAAFTAADDGHGHVLVGLVGG